MWPVATEAVTPLLLHVAPTLFMSSEKPKRPGGDGEPSRAVFHTTCCGSAHDRLPSVVMVIVSAVSTAATADGLLKSVMEKVVPRGCAITLAIKQQKVSISTSMCAVVAVMTMDGASKVTSSDR